MIMFDLLACDARAMYFGASAKVDDLKFKVSYGLNNRMNKPKEKKRINLKPVSTKEKGKKNNVANEAKTSTVKPKKEETVVPATVIENPTVEKEVIIVTEKPIDVKNIHDNAKQISSAIEEAINENADEIIEAVSMMTESGIEKFVEEGIAKNQKKFEIIVDAFMEKTEDEKAMAIYEAIIKNGDKVLESFESNTEQNVALYETFVQNVLGLKIEDVGYDGLDGVLGKYEGFKEIFQITTQRALDYLKTKDIDEVDENETKTESSVDADTDKVKLNLEDKVNNENKVDGLNMPITFVEENAETPENTESKKEQPKSNNKNSRKSTSSRKKQ